MTWPSFYYGIIANRKLITKCSVPHISYCSLSSQLLLSSFTHNLYFLLCIHNIVKTRGLGWYERQQISARDEGVLASRVCAWLTWLLCKISWPPSSAWYAYAQGTYFAWTNVTLLSFVVPKKIQWSAIRNYEGWLNYVFFNLPTLLTNCWSKRRAYYRCSKPQKRLS